MHDTAELSKLHNKNVKLNTNTPTPNKPYTLKNFSGESGTNIVN
jgi:hypothetical protein